MCNIKSKVWMISAICWVALLECSGADSGGRCHICGRITMYGSNHICIPKKSHNTGKKHLNSQHDPEKDFITGKPLKDMQKLLPPLEGHKVSGIEIEKKWLHVDEVRAYLKVEESFGKTCNWELTDPEKYANDERLQKHEKALEYYKKYTLLLPILPIKGYENRSREDLPASIIAMVQYFESEQNKARARLKIEELNIQESFRLYKAMNGLCGRKIFAERDPNDDFDINTFEGEYVKFTPEKSVWGCTEYIYLVTPKTKRIYEIKLTTKKNDDFEKIKQALEKKYNAKMDQQEDGSLQICGKNNKGNVRTIILKRDDAEIIITLSDQRGRNQAKKEGSKYLAHLREVESARQVAAEEAEKKAIEEAMLLKKNKELAAMHEFKSRLLPVGEYAYELQRLECIRKECPIHKWDECYAPKYGDDFYTDQAKAEYFQSKMAAIQASQKCTCYTEQAKQCYLSIGRARGKCEIALYDVVSKDISDKIYSMLHSTDIQLTDDEKSKLRLLMTIEIWYSTLLKSYQRWKEECEEFDK